MSMARHLRFTLATGTTLGQDQRFQMEKVEGVRNFTNKIWNAARFVLMNLEDLRMMTAALPWRS